MHPWKHSMQGLPQGLVPAAGLLLGVAAGASAQPDATPAGSAGTLPDPIDPTTGALPAFIELFNTSPILNGIILGLSVVALMLFLYFMLTINARAMVPADLVDELKKLIDRRKYEAAADLCRAHRRVFVSTIVQRAVENAGKGHSVILDMIDSEGRRRADIIWNRISYLADISNVAPMLGLLGTVTGMIKAFYAVRKSEISAASDAMTTAIGQAMSTTMFGLGVAIMALLFYTIVKSRVTRVLADAEQAVHSLADQIKRGEDDILHADPDDREAAAAVVGSGAPRFERRNLPGAGGGGR